MSQTLKIRIQNNLKKLGLYHRLKTSTVYDIYWTFSGGDLLAQRKSETNFYKELLKGFRRGDLVFDIGANHGTKTDIFLRLGARVISVDPDELNQEILRQRFHSYRISKKPVTIIGKAISDKEALETLWVDSAGSAKNTLSKKWVNVLRNDKERFGETLEFGKTKSVQTVTLDNLISKYGQPFFIKIDVEGYEPMVLRGLKKPVPFISFEVNLPEFRPEGLDCLDTLEQLTNAGRFNYLVDCRAGLILDQWVPHREFKDIFRRCEHESIEVFWKS